MIAGDLEGGGPSQPLPAVDQPHFTAPRADALQELCRQWRPVMATMNGGGVEGLFGIWGFGVGYF